MIHFIPFVFLVSILLSIDSIAAQTHNQLGSKGTEQCTINNNFSRRGREAKRTANDLGRLRIRLQKILFFYLENGLRIFQNLLLYDRAEFLSPGPTVKAETKLMASLS